MTAKETGVAGTTNSGRVRDDAGAGKVLILAVVIVVALAVAFVFLGGGGEKKKHHARHRSQASTPTSQLARIPMNRLPSSAIRTIRAIKRGGPFYSDTDGTTFPNRHHELPTQPPGYYKKYSVQGGSGGIVAGANGDLYYTTDGYSSFRSVKAMANMPAGNPRTG